MSGPDRIPDLTQLLAGAQAIPGVGGMIQQAQANMGTAAQMQNRTASYTMVGSVSDVCDALNKMKDNQEFPIAILPDAGRFVIFYWKKE